MINFKIRTKLTLGFGAIVVILLMLVSVAYLSSLRLQHANSLNVRSHETLEQTQGMLESLATIQAGIRGYALTSMDEMLAPMKTGRAAFVRQMARARELTAADPTQQQRLAKLDAEQRKWFKVAVDPLLKIRRGVTAGAIQMESLIQFEQGGRGERSMVEMRRMLGEISAAETALLQQRTADVTALQEKSNLILIGGGCAAVLVAAMIAVLLIRSIVRPMVRAVNIAQTVAAGDLSSQIEAGARDETGALLQALGDMNGSLVNIVSKVRAGSDTIAAASSEIARGNQSLSVRTEEQADALAQAARAMGELTETVRQLAGNANLAHQMADSASAVAAKGGATVMEVVSTMKSINDSSKKVVEIVALIDGIAFQTNILALNAAVEAARAGEQGRGFAVVASEVRNLAQRSAVAAKEIRSLIVESAEKVEAGSQLVEQAGATMHDIVASVDRVTTIMGEILEATQSQITGIERIDGTIRHVDSATQQNADRVQEAARAAQALLDQANNQTELMSVFKLGNASTP